MFNIRILVSKVGLPRHDKKYYSSTTFKLPQYSKKYNTQFVQSQELINTKASSNTYESIESKKCSINSLHP